MLQDSGGFHPVPCLMQAFFLSADNLDEEEAGGLPMALSWPPPHYMRDSTAHLVSTDLYTYNPSPSSELSKRCEYQNPDQTAAGATSTNQQTTAISNTSPALGSPGEATSS